MKKISLVVVMLVFMTSFLLITPANVVKATTHSITFESPAVLNNPYSDSFMTTQFVSGTEFEVDNVQVHGGTKSFHIHNSRGWWNLTYANYLINFTFWVVLTADGGNDWYHIYLFDSEQYEQEGGFVLNDDSMIHLMIAGNPNGMWYYDHNGQAVEFDDYASNMNIFHIEVNDTDETFYQYRSDNSGVTGSPRNVTAFQDNLTINRIYFEPNSCTLDIDDVTFTTAEDYSQGDPPGGDPGGEGMQSIGAIPDYECYNHNAESTFYATAIEIKHHVPMSADFHTLDLYLCSLPFVEYGLMETNYVLIPAYLNGEPLGVADEFHRISSTRAFIRWEFAEISLSNLEPIIEIDFSDYFDSGATFLQILRGEKNVDYDGDGVAIYRIGDESFGFNYVPDGRFNGFSLLYDIGYMLYYDNLQAPIVPPVVDEDQLSVSNYISQSHPIYSIPYYYENMTVGINYFLADLSIDTKLKVFYQGTETGQEQGFPINLFNNGFTHGYVPQRSGFYNASLDQNGVRVLNASFYVEPNPHDYYVYSYPNPTFNTNSYTIGYHYYNPSGYVGLLAYYYDSADIGDLDKAVTYAISNDENGTFFFTPNKVSNTYWQIYVNRSNNLIPKGDMHTHYAISGLHTGGGELNRQYSHIVLAGVTNTQRLYGYHNFMFTPVSIKINDYPKFDVTGVHEFNFIYKPDILGLNIATLEVYVNSSWIIIDTVNYTVGDAHYQDFDEDDFSPLYILVQNAFPDPVIRTIIGLVICLAITMLPYLTALKMKERHITINIPTVLYGVCFGIGVAVSYILGFFGFEVLFFIVFILISIMALMFLYGKKSASSGSEA